MIVIYCNEVLCIASRCIDDEERAIVWRQGGLQLGMQGREAALKVGITWLGPRSIHRLQHYLPRSIADASRGI